MTLLQALGLILLAAIIAPFLYLALNHSAQEPQVVAPTPATRPTAAPHTPGYIGRHRVTRPALPTPTVLPAPTHPEEASPCPSS